MAFTYVDVNPTLIPNTVMQKRLRDGVDYQYRISPAEGYVLHDNVLDSYEDYTEDGEGVGEPILGFTPATSTCAANYDFVANPRQFYAVLRNTVPEDQIFGGVNNDHEVM
jgi:hypothetical protein